MRHLESRSYLRMPAGDVPKQDDVPDPFKIEPLKSFDLYEATVAQIQKCLEEGKFSSVEYVHFCLDRVRKVNQYLEAVIETNPDAINIASGLDEERGEGSTRGPLHGIPVLVKDVSSDTRKIFLRTSLTATEYGHRRFAADYCWILGITGKPRPSRRARCCLAAESRRSHPRPREYERMGIC